MFNGYALYITIAIFIISNIIYRKIVRDLKYELNFESSSDMEILNMVKEESEKGNLKARIALICSWIGNLSMILIISLMFFSYHFFN